MMHGMDAGDMKPLGRLPKPIYAEDEVRRNLDILYKQWRLEDAGDSFVLEASAGPSSADVYFVTGNPGKLVSPRAAFGGLLSLEHIKLDIDEEQEDVREIAAHKARVACQVIQRPVLCDDSGLVIPSLGGYPGSRVGRELHDKGLEHFLALAAEQPLPAYWVQAAGYMDPGLRLPRLFISEVHGTLIGEKRGEKREYFKSDLFYSFVLEGETRTLAEMPQDEFMSRATTRRWDDIVLYVAERLG